ncbi:tyrosine-protein phosphatase [Rhodococcus sp. IEGM 1379]|uniref:tyrosine-protein phosphatase n=1 Tax=Rhodococcus sp. IEGM 1379 TaxID=3047086 RepID=UPI0024B7188A|nr:tyrosine-protein phosphatase [Rhodococcus sp. IEGM 1379]MDI9918584.1 tyrosine-protein phosphatase [Rhodococcus sp. IEGM 1379]
MNSRLIIVGIAAALTIGLSGCGQSTSDESAAATTLQSAPEAVAAATPRLLSANNFRDLAGPDGGYTTFDGRRVREGVLYRSNALVTNNADAATLDALGLKTVYDLRTTAEVEKGPDRVPAGANYTRVNIVGDAASGAITSSVDLSTPESAGAVLVTANRQFVTDPAMRAQFATLLTDIATTDGPQLFHCTAGKDRAGWTSAMLLKIAGVDDATVMSNYLLTNEYSKDSIEATAAQVTAAKGEQAGAAMKVLMGVSPEFLQAGFDEVSANFGTFDNYLTSGLGLSAGTIGILKTKLTV